MKNFLGFLSLCLIGTNVIAVPILDRFADSTGSGGTAYNVGEALTNQLNSTMTAPWYSRGAVSGSLLVPTIVAGNLSYPGLPASTGSSVSFTQGPAMAAAIDLNVASTHTATVYCSFLLKVTDISQLATTAANNPIAAFIDDPTPQSQNVARLGTRLVSKKVGAGYVLGTSKSATIADFIFEPDAAAHNVNDVLFVVMSYQRVASVQTNVLVWINPSSSTFGLSTPPTPTLTATAGNTALNNPSARGFILLQQFTGTPAGVIDDIRMSTNDWAFITGGDPAIPQSPVSQNLPPGANATFTVTAQGTPTLTYQWVKDGTTVLVNGGNISGAQTATLHLNNIGPSDLGSYAVYVTNGLGNFALSSGATLAFSDPGILNQPQSRTNLYNTTATFQVTAVGTGPFSYQWKKEGVGNLSDGGNIIGSHSNILAVTSVTYNDHGNYSVTVTGGAGNIDSVAAVLTVRDPAVTSQPASLTNLAGANVSFHATAVGSPTLSYQWKKDGNNVTDGGNISGATTDTLNVNGISSADAGGYAVVVTGGLGSSEISTTATLTVLTPAAIWSQPNSRTVVAGNRAVFAVGAVGSAPLTFQWRREGTNIPGANSFAYSIPNAQASDAGNYSVFVSNALASATSSTVSLTVTPTAPLYQNNFAVIRIGDGAQPMTLNGNSFYLDQFSTNGSYVNTVCIPETGTNAIVAIGMPNVQGTTGNITGNGVTRSANGKHLVIAGYNTNLSYGASLAAVGAVTVPRGVGVIDAAGQYSLPVSSVNTFFSQAAFRAAVYDGTNNFWGCANKGGVYYFGLDEPESPVASIVSNIRSFSVFNGDIYYASAVAGTDGIWKLNGMPHGGAPSTLLFPNGTATSDMEVSPDGNTIYVADDRSAGAGGGILKYHFDGANWSLLYAITGGLPNGVRYVGADFSGPTPVLSAVTPETENNQVLRVVDTGAASTATFVASAGVNQVFRGTRFGPIGNIYAPVLSPTLTLTPSGNSVVLSWSGSFVLQSSTNVAGTYVDVAGATSPYTNNVHSAAIKFFRLRN